MSEYTLFAADCLGYNCKHGCPIARYEWMRNGILQHRLCVARVRLVGIS
jgi:hypothetical protein